LRAEDLVDHALALEPAHRGFVLQLEHVAATVVVERLRLALDDVALGLAHLPEPGRVPRGGREMVAGLVLAQHDAIGQHRQLAADHVDAAGEDVHLAGIVIGHVVRLDLDGRVAVGLDPLRASGVPGEQQDEHQRRRDGDARSHGRGGASAAGSGCHWPRTSESTRSWRAALSNSIPTPVKVDSPRRMRTGRSVRATSVTESTIAKSVSTVMRGTPGAGSRTRRTSSISSVIRPSASVRARLAVRRTVGRSGSRLTSTGASNSVVPSSGKCRISSASIRNTGRPSPFRRIMARPSTKSSGTCPRPRAPGIVRSAADSAMYQVPTTRADISSVASTAVTRSLRRRFIGAPGLRAAPASVPGRAG